MSRKPKPNDTSGCKSVDWPAAINNATVNLEFARNSGDQLRIDLAEAALNDLLDRYSSQLSQVTGEA